MHAMVQTVLHTIGFASLKPAIGSTGEPTRKKVSPTLASDDVFMLAVMYPT
jgi:hypothetical protein